MNLLDLSERVNIDCADVIIGEEKTIEHEADAEFFYSFCMFHGELVSLNACYPVSNVFFHRSQGKGDFRYNSITLNRYARRGDRLEIVERREIAPGSDPRVVSNGEKAYAIIIGDWSRGDQALLYDFSEHRVIPIKAPTADFNYGKNWQPFLVGDALYAVHELTPLRIVNIDVLSGRSEVVREHDISFKLPAFHQTYPMLRGGANALAVGDSLLGIGHATSQRYRHHPFFWSVLRNGKLDVLFSGFFYEFHKRGYNIIDPTSLFFDRGDLYLGLCCTERDWAFTQLATHLLLRFRGHDTGPRGQPLAAWLAERPLSEEKGVANLDRHMFFCNEMPSATTSTHAFGGRLSTGAAGHLVHGPYLHLSKEGQYCAELTYMTQSGASGKAGVFDATVGKADGVGSAIRYEILESTDLVATGGALRQVHIHFSTVGRLSASLELRVYVEEGVVMNAFHIRTWRVS